MTQKQEIELPETYEPLKQAVSAIGGNMFHTVKGFGKGGAWVVELREHRMEIRWAGPHQFPLLDRCFCAKPGVDTIETWDDCTTRINPAGLAEFFDTLAKS